LDDLLHKHLKDPAIIFIQPFGNLSFLIRNLRECKINQYYKNIEKLIWIFVQSHFQSELFFETSLFVDLPERTLAIMRDRIKFIFKYYFI
jgi:hypothetical protein